jgi:hypothetical protein
MASKLKAGVRPRFKAHASLGGWVTSCGPGEKGALHSFLWPIGLGVLGAICVGVAYWLNGGGSLDANDQTTFWVWAGIGICLIVVAALWAINNLLFGTQQLVHLYQGGLVIETERKKTQIPWKYVIEAEFFEWYENAAAEMSLNVKISTRRKRMKTVYFTSKFEGDVKRVMAGIQQAIPDFRYVRWQNG